jgi:hypothetical protein
VRVSGASGKGSWHEYKGGKWANPHSPQVVLETAHKIDKFFFKKKQIKKKKKKRKKRKGRRKIYV